MENKTLTNFMTWFGPLVIIGVFLWFLLGQTPAQELFCKPDENCFREWVSALSGWVAAAVAAATIIPLWRQLAEMRRQTRFLVGDDLPTLELSPNSWGQSGRFRVINWNRQPFFICEMRWSAPVEIAVMETVAINDEPYCEVHPNGQLLKRIEVEGWETRSIAPPSIEADFGFVTTNAVPRDIMVTASARLEVVGYLSGEQRKRITIVANAPLKELELMD